jgi:hypothetical protein
MYVYTVHSIFYCYILLSFVRMMRLSTGSKRASSSSQGGTSSRTASSSLVPQIARQLIPDNNQDDAKMEDEEAEEELFSRGPSRLPQAPAREDGKPILTPQGDMYVHLENELICTGIMLM